MKTITLITTALMTGSLFTGAAMAGNSGQGVEDDMIYGHGMVKASPGEPYIYADPVANELQGVLLSNPGEYTHEEPTPTAMAVAGADNHDDSDSILHTPEAS